VQAPAATRPEAPARAAQPRADAAARRLVVVSNRVASGSKSSAGGLAVGVLAALSQSGGIWFGWSGETDPAPAGTPELSRDGNVTFATLDLRRQDLDEYYNGFANRVLWPLFHFRTSLVGYRRTDLEGYLRVNRQIATALRPLLRTNDLVWVHDYHLIPCGEELRRLGAAQPLGFFLHTPFPPTELLRVLPNHSELMRSLCAYDLVGFQTENDLHSFRDYLVREIGGTDLGGGRIAAFGRVVHAEVFPIGTDVEKLAELAATAARSRQARRMLDSLGGRALAIGVDRLDYSKGLHARFKAFERFTAKYPETRGHVTFMHIAPPSRSEVPEYTEIRRELETAAGHINGRFAEFDWTQIRYLNKSFAQRTLAGFFRLSRIGLVTPLRDGMNLVAKEYVASQDPENPGALVLSNLAGAARELTDAVLVDPFDIEGMAEAIHRALVMPLEERRERWQEMIAVLRRNDITAWRESFVRRLAATRGQ
jgi:trehalose 6-phosphate synthase